MPTRKAQDACETAHAQRNASLCWRQRIAITQARPIKVNVMVEGPDTTHISNLLLDVEDYFIGRYPQVETLVPATSDKHIDEPRVAVILREEAIPLQLHQEAQVLHLVSVGKFET